MITSLAAPAANSAAMSRRTVSVVVSGAVIGLTWAAALRGWMIQMAGYQSTVHWYGTFALVLTPGLCVGALFGLAEHRRRTGGPRSRWLALAPCLFLAALADPAIFKALITNGLGGGAIGVEWTGTFLWVLLPGALIGALLGSAEYQRWTGTVRHRRWLIWSPMLFVAVLLSNPRELLNGFAGGVGLSAVAVPAMCMLGGYAIAGTGPRWVRGLCGLVALSAIPIWSVTAVDVGSASMSLRDPHGAWAPPSTGDFWQRSRWRPRSHTAGRRQHPIVQAGSPCLPPTRLSPRPHRPGNHPPFHSRDPINEPHTWHRDPLRSAPSTSTAKADLSYAGRTPCTFAADDAPLCRSLRHDGTFCVKLDLLP